MTRVQIKWVLGVFILIALLGCVLAFVEQETSYAIFGILGGLVGGLFTFIAQTRKPSPLGQTYLILQKLDPPTRRKFGVLFVFVHFSPYLFLVALVVGIWLKWPNHILSVLSQTFLVTIILSRVGWFFLRRWMTKKFAENQN